MPYLIRQIRFISNKHHNHIISSLTSNVLVKKRVINSLVFYSESRIGSALESVRCELYAAAALHLLCGFTLAYFDPL